MEALPSGDRIPQVPTSELIGRIAMHGKAGESVDARMLFIDIDILANRLDSIPEDRRGRLIQGFQVLGRRQAVIDGFNDRLERDERGFLGRRENILGDLRLASLLGIENERISKLREEYEPKPVEEAEPPRSNPVASRLSPIVIAPIEPLDEQPESPEPSPAEDKAAPSITYDAMMNDTRKEILDLLKDEPGAMAIGTTIQQAQYRYRTESGSRLDNMWNYANGLGSYLLRRGNPREAAACFQFAVRAPQHERDFDRASSSVNLIQAVGEYFDREPRTDASYEWLSRRYTDLLNAGSFLNVRDEAEGVQSNESSVERSRSLIREIEEWREQSADPAGSPPPPIFSAGSRSPGQPLNERVDRADIEADLEAEAYDRQTRGELQAGSQRVNTDALMSAGKGVQSAPLEEAVEAADTSVRPERMTPDQIDEYNRIKDYTSDAVADLIKGEPDEADLRRSINAALFYTRGDPMPANEWEFANGVGLNLHRDGRYKAAAALFRVALAAHDQTGNQDQETLIRYAQNFINANTSYSESPKSTVQEVDQLVAWLGKNLGGLTRAREVILNAGDRERFKETLLHANELLTVAKKQAGLHPSKEISEKSDDQDLLELLKAQGLNPEAYPEFKRNIEEDAERIRQERNISYEDARQEAIDNYLGNK